MSTSSQRPLVSVIMPCFNAAGTVRRAVASMLAQTFEDWELIVVDDGSADSTRALLEELARRVGPRIRVDGFSTNRGRGPARQHALELTRGRWLAMVDADDWIYPTKLATQLTVADREPGAVAISMAMAVVGEADALVGIHSRLGPADRPQHIGPWTRIGRLPIPHAPSLLDGERARRTGFDPAFRFSEDAEFLTRLLLDQRMVLLPEVGYAYAEPGSITLDKALASYSATRRIMRRHARRFPVRSTAQQLALYGKGLVWRLASATGQEQRVLALHHREPTPAERAAYERALAVVRQAEAGTLG
jgi:glycosyltransferase involved in cell wall biosynthesis